MRERERCLCVWCVVIVCDWDGKKRIVSLFHRKLFTQAEVKEESFFFWLFVFVQHDNDGDGDGDVVCSSHIF